MYLVKVFGNLFCSKRRCKSPEKGELLLFSKKAFLEEQEFHLLFQEKREAFQGLGRAGTEGLVKERQRLL